MSACLLQVPPSDLEKTLNSINLFFHGQYMSFHSIPNSTQRNKNLFQPFANDTILMWDYKGSNSVAHNSSTFVGWTKPESNITRQVNGVILHIAHHFLNNIMPKRMLLPQKVTFRQISPLDISRADLPQVAHNIESMLIVLSCYWSFIGRSADKGHLISLLGIFFK